MEAAYISLKQQVRRKTNELEKPKIETMTKVFGKPDVVSVYQNKFMSEEQKKKFDKLINENHLSQQ